MFNLRFFFTLLTFIILLIHPPIAVAGTLTLVVRGNDYFDFDKSHGRYGEHRPNPRVSALLWSLKQVGIRTVLVSPLLEGFTVYGGNKTLTKKIYFLEKASVFGQGFALPRAVEKNPVLSIPSSNLAPSLFEARSLFFGYRKSSLSVVNLEVA